MPHSRFSIVIGIVAVAAVSIALTVQLTAQVLVTPVSRLMICADLSPKDGTLSAKEMRTALTKQVKQGGCDLDGNSTVDRADTVLMVKTMREVLTAPPTPTPKPVPVAPPAPKPAPTPVPSVCGNGKVEGAEQCDDGNLQDGDACSNACTERAVVNSRGELHLSTSGVNPAVQHAMRWRAVGAPEIASALRDRSLESVANTGINLPGTQINYATVTERLTLTDPAEAIPPMRTAFVELLIDRGWGLQHEVYPLPLLAPFHEVAISDIEVHLTYSAAFKQVFIELMSYETRPNGTPLVRSLSNPLKIDTIIHNVNIASLSIFFSQEQGNKLDAKVESGLQNRCHGDFDPQFFRSTDGGCAYIVKVTASGEEGTVFSAEQKFTGTRDPESYCANLVEGGRDDWSLLPSGAFTTWSPLPIEDVRRALGLSQTYYPQTWGMVNVINGSSTSPRDASIRSVLCAAPLRGLPSVPEGMLFDNSDENFSTSTLVNAWTEVQEPRAIGGTVTQITHSVASGKFEERTRATWHVTNMPPGLYEVFITWVPRENEYNTKAKFTAPMVRNFAVIDELDFRQNPTYGMGGRGWFRTLARIGDDGSTTFELSSTIGDALQADAILLRRRAD